MITSTRIRACTGPLVTGMLAAALLITTTSQAAERGLDLTLAKQLAASASEFARKHSAPGAAIAVVDAGGHLVYLERLDNTFPAASTVATEKARTAAVFQRPTKALEDAVNSGRAALLGVQVMTPLQGGVPIVLDGRMVGAVGVSGAASAAQDEEIGRAAAASVN